MSDFENAKFLLLEAVARLELAARPRTPPPPPPQPWDPNDGSPSFDVTYRSCARSRSPSPMVQSMVCASPQDAAPVIESPKARTPPVHFWRRRRGFREAYASPLARLPPIVTHCVVRSGALNPKYERVGEFLVVRYRLEVDEQYK